MEEDKFRRLAQENYVPLLSVDGKINDEPFVYFTVTVCSVPCTRSVALLKQSKIASTLACVLAGTNSTVEFENYVPLLSVDGKINDELFFQVYQDFNYVLEEGEKAFGKGNFALVLAVEVVQINYLQYFPFRLLGVSVLMLAVYYVRYRCNRHARKTRDVFYRDFFHFRFSWRADLSQRKDPVKPEEGDKVEPNHYMVLKHADNTEERITLLITGSTV